VCRRAGFIIFNFAQALIVTNNEYDIVSGGSSFIILLFQFIRFHLIVEALFQKCTIFIFNHLNESIGMSGCFFEAHGNYFL